MCCDVIQYTGMPMMDVKVHMMSIPIDMNGNIVPNGQAPGQGQGQGQRPNNGNTESATKVSVVLTVIHPIRLAIFHASMMIFIDPLDLLFSILIFL